MYCSKECQKINWTQHKAECAHLRDFENMSPQSIDEVIILLRTLKLCFNSHHIDCSCQLTNAVTTCSVAHALSMSDAKLQFDDEILSVISTVCTKTKHPMQLVGKLFFQFRCNNFGVTDDLLTCVAVGVYPHAALLNHSCAPNCVLRYVLSDSGPILQVCGLFCIA